MTAQPGLTRLGAGCRSRDAMMRRRLGTGQLPAGNAPHPCHAGYTSETPLDFAQRPLAWPAAEMRTPIATCRAPT